MPCPYAGHFENAPRHAFFEHCSKRPNYGGLRDETSEDLEQPNYVIDYF